MFVVLGPRASTHRRRAQYVDESCTYDDFKSWKNKKSIDSGSSIRRSGRAPTDTSCENRSATRKSRHVLVSRGEDVGRECMPLEILPFDKLLWGSLGLRQIIVFVSSKITADHRGETKKKNGFLLKFVQYNTSKPTLTTNRVLKIFETKRTLSFDWILVNFQRCFQRVLFQMLVGIIIRRSIA